MQTRKPCKTRFRTTRNTSRLGKCEDFPIAHKPDEPFNTVAQCRTIFGSKAFRWSILAFHNTMYLPRTLCCTFALLASIATAAKNPKRGLAFAEGDNPNDIKKADQAASVVSWQYDWGTAPPDYLAKTTISYVPMQWGTNGIETFASKAKAQGAKRILSFNEPDFASQSNINATYAAQLWKQYIQPLAASGIRLGAPAVTNAPSGRPWLAQFLAACTGCTIDFIPFHWYGTGIGSFYDYLWQMHGQFPSYPLWVTEFATTSTNDAEVVDFLNSTIRYMDTLDWIQGYAWFGYFRKEGTSHYNLLDANGNLNDLGKIYVNA